MDQSARVKPWICCLCLCLASTLRSHAAARAALAVALRRRSLSFFPSRTHAPLAIGLPQMFPAMQRNGGFGTFLRAFYASLERQRRANPSVAAVAFGGSDDEWASLQVKLCDVDCFEAPSSCRGHVNSHASMTRPILKLTPSSKIDGVAVGNWIVLTPAPPVAKFPNLYRTPLTRWAIITANTVISHHARSFTTMQKIRCWNFRWELPRDFPEMLISTSCMQFR